ncbi:MAG: hypothetical protein QM747_04680 [Nocardioides sp.]
MTTSVAETLSSPTRDRRQPLALCALVAVGAVVGWLAYFRWGLPHLETRVYRWELVADHFGLLNLATALLLFAPYAAFLLVWGLTAVRRVGAALVALAAAGYMWGLYEVFDSVVWNSPTGGSNRSGVVYVWLNILVLPTLVALAWGVARRHGRVWPAGLVLAPMGAAVIRELGLHSTWWHTHVHFQGEWYSWLLAELEIVGPGVLAAVVCWLLDRPQWGRPPEVGL